ncbi:hypothetical protein HOG21_01880 [bacterium]|nr:hypothetical protein [bacterium]
MSISHIIKKSIIVTIVGIISDQNSSLLLSFILTFVLISLFFSQRSFSESFLGSITTSLFIFFIHLFSITPQLIVAKALFQSINISLYNHFE